ncbi:hypothetical protein D9M68_917440 [compost metagenome]
MLDRGQDGRAGVYACQQVRDRDPRFHRFAGGVAGDAHQAAHALENEVIPGQGRVGAVLAEAGDRAVDQARIDLPQAVVVQPVARQRADLVVLDQHVGIPGQLDDERLAFRCGQVDGD